MSHFGENVMARERSDRGNLFSQHNEIASPPSAARNDACDIVEILKEFCALFQRAYTRRSRVRLR